MSEYEVQAMEFLKKAETRMHISRIGEAEECGMWHYKYLITLTRKGKQYRFTFYDSFHNWRNNKRPGRYDVLATVEKYEVADSVEEFAHEFGYLINDYQDEKRVNKIWEACRKQYQRLLDLFGDELMKELLEIN